MLVDLLRQSIQFLKIKVDNYNSNGLSTDIIEISNISTLNDGDEFLETTSPIILSIINMEEDKVARNPNIFIKQNNEASTSKKHLNPAQNLIISLLFSAYNKEQTKEKYLDGISKLEHVIRCFQEQHVFHINGTLEVNANTQPHTKLILDMESMKFNELNQLWSMLGNKYMPSVLYKMRMITIQSDPIDGDKNIEKFKIQLADTPNKDTAIHLESSNDIN